MADMLVKLFHRQPDPAAEAALLQNGVRLCRALPPDRDRVIGFVRENFPEFAAEAACAFSHLPAHCWLAVENRAVVGFACYDVTARISSALRRFLPATGGAASAGPCCCAACFP